MSVAMFIAIESENPGFNTFVNGKFLARNQEKLDALAKRLKITPLTQFFSASDADREFLKEQIANLTEIADPKDERSQAALKKLRKELRSAETWFKAADGLKTVGALLEALRAKPEQLDRQDGVISDLEEFVRVLTAAKTRKLRWHLSWDY
jgi:hypothetical protein